jgi:hypothetical protein
VRILGVTASSILKIPPSSYESIATVTVGAGGTGSISFTSIPSTYTHLQVRGVVRSAESGSSIVPINFRFNSNASNYTYHLLKGNGSAASASATTNDSLLNMAYGGQASKTADVYGGFVMDILDYTNTNKYKTIRSLWGVDFNGSGEVGLHSGFWYNSTNAISSIVFYCNSGNDNFRQYTQFALYGIKGS